MPVKHPILDDRAFQDILAELKARAGIDVQEWKPGEGDAGIMIQRIFARLLSLTLERLNRVPEKNLLAFLDKLGVSLLPPSPARVPLTFGLAPGNTATRVPKGTQAGSQPSAGKDSVVFETEDDLTVLPAKIVTSFTMDPTWDRYSDQTSVLNGQTPEGFTPFVGTKRMPHMLYLGDDLLLEFAKASVNIYLQWQLNQLSEDDEESVKSFLKGLTWQYIRDGQPKALSPTIPEEYTFLEEAIDADSIYIKLNDIIGLNVGDKLTLIEKNSTNISEIVIIDRFDGNLVYITRENEKQSFSAGSTVVVNNHLIIEFADIEFIDRTVLQSASESRVIEEGVSSRWLQAIISTPFPDTEIAKNLSIKDPVLKVKAENLLPEYAFCNTTPLDVSKEFYPFGEFPKPGDAFYLTSKEIFSKPEVKATINIAVAEIDIAWEYWNGTKWQVSDSTEIVDQTSFFNQNGNVIIKFNDKMEYKKLFDQHAIWFRARITSGRYVGVPRINSFGIQGIQSTLTADAESGATKLNIDSGVIKMESVILIEDEFALVSDIDNNKVTICPALQERHRKGSLVECQYIKGSWLYLGILQNFAAASTNLLTVFSYYPMRAKQVWNINTPKTTSNLEFITIENVIIEDPKHYYKITTQYPLRFTHPEQDCLLPIEPYLSVVREGKSLNSLKSFLPFGKTPCINEELYFGYTIDIWKSDDPPEQIEIEVRTELELPKVELRWEYWNVNDWQSFENLIDETHNLMQGGNILLSAQSYLPTEVNGKINYWFRVRIVSGNYGLPAEYIPDPTDPTKGFVLKEGTGNLKSPVLNKLSLSYEADSATSQLKPTVLTQNCFLLKDHTDAEEFPLFESVQNLPTIYADTEPAFYIGFDAPFSEMPVDLYIAVAPRAFAGSVTKETGVSVEASSLPALIWEYFNGNEWKKLMVFDGTENLTESGAIEFLGPKDMAPLAKFDATPRYWIRARSASNDPLDTQRLLGVFLNTVPAIQVVTTENEIIGSSNGQPDQVFRLSKSPVLPGQQILVREAELPSEQERINLELEEGEDAVQEHTNSTTGEKEIWVRWHEVISFLLSDSHSRHYTIDRLTGEIKFGDGKRGLIPPRGTNNIMAAKYRSGGGANGNLPADMIKQLKTTLAGVNTVYNPVPADGGAETETVQMVEERGPQTLRHRDRAVTAGDIEWLARQAAGARVARAKCLPNINRELRFEPGWTTLMIIPQGTESKLTPSSELINQVQDYLMEGAYAGLAELNPEKLNVIGPGYIEVSVDAEIVPRDIDEAEQVKQQVLAALDHFLHPLTGGAEGNGWEFGHDVYVSEVYQLLEGIQGVDHVKSLTLSPNIAQCRLTFVNAPFAEMDFPEGHNLVKVDHGKAALLAEPIASGLQINSIAIKGFKEGDQITRVLDVIVQPDAVDSTKAAVSGNTITVVSFNSDTAGFPKGSLIMSFDGKLCTHLSSGILPSITGITEITVDDNDFISQMKPNDKLTLFYPFPMTITSVTQADLTEQTLGIEPFENEVMFPESSLFATLDNKIRLPLTSDIAENQIITAISVEDFKTDEELIISKHGENSNIFNLKIQELTPADIQVYLDENFIVYSGKHHITIVAE